MHNTLSLIQPWYVFAPSILFAISQFPAWGRRIQLPLFGLLITVGFGVLAWLFSLPMAVISLAGGVVISLFLALLNLTGRSLTLLLGLAVSTLPLGAWIYPFAGLVAAGLLSAVFLLRSNGVNHVKYTAWETLAAVGWDGGGLRKPSPGRLPINFEVKPSGNEPKDNPVATGDENWSKTPPRISVHLAIGLALLLGAGIGFFRFSA